MGDNVSESFRYCQAFRRLAKRIRQLGRTPGKLSEQAARTSVLEDLWDLAGEIDVWVCGIAERLNKALVHVYVGEDESAAEIMDALADEELKRLQAQQEEESGEGGG